jgi:hypothetical protein
MSASGREPPWLNMVASCHSEGETRLKICDQLPDNRLLELKELASVAHSLRALLPVHLPASIRIRAVGV